MMTIMAGNEYSITARSEREVSYDYTSLYVHVYTLIPKLES